MRSLLLLLGAFACGVSALGQALPMDPVGHAGTLISNGKYDEAISTLNSILNSQPLDDLHRGRAQMLLGIADKESGQLREAEQEYNLAIQSLKNYPDSPDYARTLACMGGLKRDTGDLKLSRQLLLQARDLESKHQDHTGLGWTNLHLAGLAIRENHLRAAEKSIREAREEALLSTPAPKDLIADIDGTQGWLDTARGRHAEAVADFVDALNQSKVAFGELHPVTGWAFLLLGRARAAEGDVSEGLEDMRSGLRIIRSAEGEHTTVLAYGELAYAKVLDAAGNHSEAVTINREATQMLARVPQGPCVNCTVSALSLGYR